MRGQALADVLRVEVDVDEVDVVGHLAEDRLQALGLDGRGDGVVDLEQGRVGQLIAQPVATRVESRAKEHDLGSAVRDLALENVVHVPSACELEPKRAGQYGLEDARAQAADQRHLGERAQLQAGRDEVLRHVVRVPDLGVPKRRPGRAKGTGSLGRGAGHPALLSFTERHGSPTLSAPR